MTQQDELRLLMEANLLDGDKVQGGQMIAATEILDFLSEVVAPHIKEAVRKARIDELEGIPLDNRGGAGVWLSMSLEERDRRIAQLQTKPDKVKEGK